MKCPSCGGNMKLLLTSYYCPMDCDKKSSNDTKSIELRWGGNLWRMALTEPGEDCPSWATHRWWILASTENFEKLTKTWGYNEGPSVDWPTPGWPIESRVDGARSDSSRSAVFCKISK